jgi:uncharacterized protein YcbK (DUF882 family)
MKWRFKLCGIIGFILLALNCPTNLAFGKPNPRGDGRIMLYSYHNDEVLEITFRSAAGYDQSALKKINRLMRCRGTQDIHPISPQLIDLLDNIQDHFNAETVEIISGYRSPFFNDYLIVNGHGAASESLHTKGMAADIHIDEIKEKDVWEYVKSLKTGGAGYYPRYNFVHVDVGPTRIWRESDPETRIMTGMELSPNNGWSVITDKNIYKPGESIGLTIINAMQERAPLVKDFWYDRFRKGKWSEHQVIEKSKQVAVVSPGKSYKHTLKLDVLPYGKYRIVVFTSRDFSVPPAYSNEFYVKKNN